MEEIIAKHGEFTGNFSRAMEFGADTSEKVVMNLVVCDGDKTRGQREALLNGNLTSLEISLSKGFVSLTISNIIFYFLSDYKRIL